jgi:hypothetical protein
MPIDLVKVLNKISPVPDGEDEVRLRTGVVSAVNSGTVDLTLSGAVFPGVPVLDGVSLAVGSVVQVLSSRGYLLVIGGTSAGNSTKVENYLATNVTTASTTYTPFTTTNIHGVVFVAPASGAVKITLQGWLGVSHTSVATRSWLSGQVREGNVVNSGTIVSAADDARAGMSQNSTTAAFDYKYVNASYVVSGLTPGSAYNVTGHVRVTAGTVGTQDRRILVEPW